MKISQLGEKKLIKRLLEKRDKYLDITDPTIFQSYRDDAAIQKNNDTYTVLSTDMLIQHSHFPKQMTPFQMGEKIVTVNVSDIIAMNAKPESILISMALPESLLVSEFDELIDGILHKCREYNITLIGGDLNQNDEIILSATTTGQINKNIKLQNNIKKDDLIAVTGKLGSPAAAFDLLINNENITIPEHDKEEIIKSILEPDLPIKTSEILRKYPEIVTSMTDITDGIAIELGHLSENNKKLGFQIYKDKLPYNKYIKKIAKFNNKPLNEYLLHFGEEFELLLTLNEKSYEKYKEQLNDIDIIGRVNDSRKITLIEDNTINNIEIKGYEHLKDD